MMNVRLLLLLLLLTAACASAAERAPPREPEPARARAALATLQVDNHSGERLTIIYRLASRGTAEVAIGHVPPQAAAVLAPVPAGEPLLLIARTAAGAELTLPARAFTIDGDWVWTIPADAVFQAPASAAGTL